MKTSRDFEVYLEKLHKRLSEMRNRSMLTAEKLLKIEKNNFNNRQLNALRATISALEIGRDEFLGVLFRFIDDLRHQYDKPEKILAGELNKTISELCDLKDCLRDLQYETDQFYIELLASKPLKKLGSDDDL